MLKFNIDEIKRKISDYSKKTIGEKYVLSNKIYNTFLIIDPKFIDDVFSKTKIDILYKNATMIVSKNISNGMVVVPNLLNRDLTLIFKDESKDVTEPFFEIVDLVEKLTKDNLERLILIGFFMNEDRMAIIQSFNILTNEIMGILYGEKN